MRLPWFVRGERKKKQKLQLFTWPVSLSFSISILSSVRECNFRSVVTVLETKIIIIIIIVQNNTAFIVHKNVHGGGGLIYSVLPSSYRHRIHAIRLVRTVDTLRMSNGSNHMHCSNVVFALKTFYIFSYLTWFLCEERLRLRAGFLGCCCCCYTVVSLCMT